MAFNYAQTFYLDPNSVGNADKIFLTSIDLYFSDKPSANNNNSGIVNPGVQIAIAPTVTTIPDLTKVNQYSVVKVGYTSITTSNTATIATNFKFPTPIPVATGQTYAILITFDDVGYKLWTAGQGETLLGTNVPFSGFAGKFQGQLFAYNNNGTWNATQNRNITFDVKVAKFTSNSATVELVNRDYEFLTYTSGTGSFYGGEQVYVVGANGAGTISVNNASGVVTGTGTSFTTYFVANDYFVLINGSNNIVRQVQSITNNTILTMAVNSTFTNAAAKYYKTPTAKVYMQKPTTNTIYLVDSNANTSLNFAAAGVMNGEISNASVTISNVTNYQLHQFEPEILINLNHDSSASLTYNLSNNAYNVDAAREAPMVANTIVVVNQYDGMMASKTNEVNNPTNLYSNKSDVIKVTLSVAEPTTNLYESPYLYKEKIDIFSVANYINNDATNENTRYGNAQSKHISTKINLGAPSAAEDLIVYLTAYKPSNTNILVYGKLHNSNDQDAFETKDWTLLQAMANSDQQVSSSSNLNDLIELAYNLPLYPPTLFTSGGTVTTNNTVYVIGSNTTFQNDYSVGDLIKIYPALFPNNYFISVVSSVDSNTQIQLTDAVTNTGVVGSGLTIEKIKTPHTAFRRIMNSNVSSYYNSLNMRFDQFDTFQIKLVLLSANSGIVPRIDDLRAIGTSA